MEVAPDSRQTEPRLRLWPAGQDRLLAEAHFHVHGRWIRWLADVPVQRPLGNAGSNRRSGRHL